MAIHHPLLGVGSEKDFRKKYSSYRVVDTRWKSAAHSHNDILQSWLNGGLAGLTGYLGLFVCLFIAGWKRSRDGPILLGLFCAIVAMFIQGWSQCYFTDAENSWLFWAMAGLLVIPERKKFPD
jgi:O-antigen ligase